jgi:hypothetical protein
VTRRPENLTEFHDLCKLGRTKLHHDRVGVTVDHDSIMRTPVSNAIFGLHFL